jgi:hypothetical protein
METEKYLYKWVTFDYADCYYFSEITFLNDSKKSGQVAGIMYDNDKKRHYLIKKKIENFEESIESLDFLDYKESQKLYKIVIREIWEDGL